MPSFPGHAPILDDSEVNDAVHSNTYWAHNWERIGSGASKDVYALNDDYVLKVHTGWVNQIATEVAIWLAASEDDRQYFAPIVQWADDFSWSIQRRCTPVEYEDVHDPLDHYNIRSECEPLMEATVRHHNLRDIDDNNLGWLDGRMVAIDYGLHNWD